MTDVARLYGLQKIDSNWEKVRRRLLQLQKLLAEPEEVLAARQALAASDAEMEAWQRRQQEAEEQARALSERVRSTEQTLMSGSVRNPKELESLQASADALRRQHAAVEEQGVEAMLYVEERSAQREQHSNALRKLETAWEKKHADLIEDEAKTKRFAVQLRAQRARLIEQTPAEDLALYEDLRKRKAGVAIAVVENGLCTSCNVRVPTGIASSAKGREQIVYCTSCGRILVA